MENPRILVPTDLSELSLTALASANYLADVLDGSILALHVYQSDLEKSSFPIAPKSTRQISDIEKELKRLVLEYADEDNLEPVVVRRGKPWKIIMEESEDADIVVMSSHGKSGFSRLFLGSVTERVVRFSKAPVLLVEKESNLKPLTDILLTTDFSDHSLQAFDYARALVKKTYARIHLVHLVNLSQFKVTSSFENQITAIQERLNKWVSDHLDDIRDKVTADVLPVKTSVHEAIVHLTNQKKYNLIVMSTLGHTGLDYLRLGSTAANVLRLVKTAVLSINPKMDDDVAKDHI